jgi:predicted ATPase
VTDPATVELSSLAKAHADLGQFDDAWRCINEAKMMIEKTKETWFEADVHRIAGEVALKLQPNVAKAEDCFERALAVARLQKAKSWELRAAMSLARLWRATRARLAQRANCLLRFTAGSLKGSTRAI